MQSELQKKDHKKSMAEPAVDDKLKLQADPRESMDMIMKWVAETTTPSCTNMMPCDSQSVDSRGYSKDLGNKHTS